MAGKKSRSEKQTDIFGREYTQHFDEDGDKEGWSEDRTGLFGDKYVEHYTQSGTKTGWSEERTDILGKKYTEHHQEPNTVARKREAPSHSHSNSDNYSTGTLAVPSAGRTIRGGLSGFRLFSIVYWGAVVCFWVWNLSFFFKGDNPQHALESMLQTLSSLWSPTGDPVLNFLIDAVLVVVGLALIPGIVVGGIILIAIAIVLSIVVIAIGLLVSLAKVSITGAIVASIIVAAILFFFARSILRR